MNWYYAADGRPCGPLSEEHFQHLVQTGVITPHTLVWHEGMTEWQAYQQVAVAPPSTPRSAGALCACCGQWHAQEEMIRYEGKWICAPCKPLFLQRLKEGAPFPSAAQAILTETQLLDRDYRIEIGDCLTRAWNVFAARPGLVIGATALSGLVFLALGLVSTLIGVLIPFGGQLLMMIFSGPLVGGLIWFFLRLARNEAAEIGDIFAGFRRQFTQLLLASLVQELINFACMIPVFIVLMLLAFFPLMTQKTPPIPLLAGLVLAFITVLLLAGAAVLFLTTIWTFSLMLIVDKGYRFWPAMQLSRKLVMKRFWMTLVFLLVAGIIMGAGAFGCLVGLLVTVPLFYAMKVFLYEDNFRDLMPAQP